jgi:hypothetical protein
VSDHNSSSGGGWDTTLPLLHVLQRLGRVQLMASSEEGESRCVKGGVNVDGGRATAVDGIWGIRNISGVGQGYGICSGSVPCWSKTPRETLR